jgi:peptidoglycan-associated lipoprotein
MNASKIRISLLAIAFTVIMAGCHHKQPVAKVTPPPPAVAPVAPAASVTVTPETVDQGQTVELSWKTENASKVNIEGIGPVSASGSKTLTPGASTTYRLTATGDGGSTDASARVTVNTPQKQVSQITDEELFAQSVKDIFFSYDDAKIGQDQQSALNADADFLAKHPAMKLVIEGHCDERGSEDYNLGLGENRASTVKSILAQHGVGADRVRVISMGKEKPFCSTAENESCWQQNRRAHFVFSN